MRPSAPTAPSPASYANCARGSCALPHPSPELVFDPCLPRPQPCSHPSTTKGSDHSSVPSLSFLTFHHHSSSRPLPLTSPHPNYNHSATETTEATLTAALATRHIRAPSGQGLRAKRQSSRPNLQHLTNVTASLLESPGAHVNLRDSVATERTEVSRSIEEDYNVAVIAVPHLQDGHDGWSGRFDTSRSRTWQSVPGSSAGQVVGMTVKSAKAGGEGKGQRVIYE